jgi:hypothetical protein
VLFRERLRNESRHGAIVGVHVVTRVRVSLDLAVVEVEVRHVIETIVGIRKIVFVHPSHQSLNALLTGGKVRSYSCILCESSREIFSTPSLDKDKQYLLKTTLT